MGRYTAAQKLKQFAGLAASGFAAFCGVCIYKENENFYRNLMSMLQWVEPERAHTAAVWALSRRLVPANSYDGGPRLRASLLGHQFKNPVGLAAGFDKHGEAGPGLEKLGFGFIEVGSVTPEPQDGNPKPRVFRLSEDKAVINRYGFNSEGHDVVYERLKKLKEDKLYTGILGINLGKNKQSADPVEDYVKGVRKFGELADYLVINVSSPNTPGLRSLQGKKDLSKLLESVIAERNRLQAKNPTPILIKIAPDLTDQDKKDIADVITSRKTRVDGLIVSNTTISRPEILESYFKNETGGLSGAPLSEMSTSVISDMYQLTKGSVPIVGVGGVASGKDAYEKIVHGASLVQVYTAFVFEGPTLVNRIKRELCQLLEEEGFKSVQEAVGSAHAKK